MDKQLTFRDRIALLENAAKCLDDVVCVIVDEIERMHAAEKRFAERGSFKRKASR